jgi:hypothetical protein
MDCRLNASASRTVALTALMVLAAACGPGAAKPAALPAATKTAVPVRTALLPTQAVESIPVRPSATAALPPPSPTPATIGPGYREGINPLSGLPVSDPAALKRVPLMVSISKFPPSSRPQSGLSLASQVWETYIGEGMTRLLAVFYGDYADQLQAILSNRLVEGGDGFVIGPVRSGRVVYQDIKTLFPRARLITAGASAEVAAQLTNRSSVFGNDPKDINSTGVQAAELSSLTPETAVPAEYASLIFDPQPPAGGSPAPSLRIIYNYLNRVGWKYDAASGAYAMSMDRSDGTDELVPATDRLTGEPLLFPNVLVLFAQHRVVNPAGTIIEMQLLYVWDQFGLLLRDGKVYEIQWSTRAGHLQITDRSGAPLALKPGPSFFEVVNYGSLWSKDKLEVRFHNPPLP